MIESRSKFSVNVSSLGHNTNEDTDAKRNSEKVEKYKKTIENYKQNHDLLMQQMSLLKGEIKNYKQKYEDLLNFGGRIGDYQEFKSAVMKILETFKPKKKEQEEIVKKIKDHLSIETQLHEDPSLGSEKKKGFFGGLFGKKK